MSNLEEEDETQIEQEVDAIEEDDFEEADDQEIETMIEEPDMETTTGAESATIQPKKREKREPVVLIREPGKTILPFARVQKIIKADKVKPFILSSPQRVSEHNFCRKYQLSRKRPLS